MSDYSSSSEVEKQRLQTQRMIDNVQVAMPAKIVTFFPGTTPKAHVQPLTQMKITLGEEVSYKSLPIVENVPVIIPYAQTAGLLITLPLKAGDKGLFIIPDRGIDNFLKGGGKVTIPPFNGNPATAAPRAHSLTDGIFVPGLSPDSDEIKDYNTENIEIRDKERKNYISLGPNGIEMTDGTCKMTIKDGNFKVDTPNTATITSKNMRLGEGHNTFRDGVSSENGTFIDNDGVVLNSHRHSGVQTGSGDTAEPVK